MIPVVNFKDGYKVDHIRQYPKNTVKVYSNFTPRASRTGFNHVVVFGLQYFVKEFLMRQYHDTFFGVAKQKAVTRYKRRLDNYLGKDAVPVEHIARLWDLGYLPLHIKSLDEGTLSDLKVPLLTITNTHDDFFWLPNDVETLLSCELWKPCTSATTAFRFRRLLEGFAKQTGEEGFVDYQAHDFAMRGMSGVHDAMSSGAAHLLSFFGTDTMPAIDWLEEYYGADSDKEMVGCSVYATEHSVMCMGTKDDEIGTFERLLFELYPNAPVLSVVSDTWSLSRVCEEFLPKLKERILKRPGKLVIRPDSGDPVKILCGWWGKDYMEAASKGEHAPEPGSFYNKGLIQSLWETFGGTLNEKGYKVLDTHIGAIYGDSITLERAETILSNLKKMGFASTNVVFGVGSFTYQYQTRDSYGFAMKATYGEVLVENQDDLFDQGGPSIGDMVRESREIFKNPETDNGEKKSAVGLLAVSERLGGAGLVLHDHCTKEQEQLGLLTTLFLNGKLVKKTTLAEIRKKLKTYL